MVLARGPLIGDRFVEATLRRLAKDRDGSSSSYPVLYRRGINSSRKRDEGGGGAMEKDKKEKKGNTSKLLNGKYEPVSRLS